MLSAGDEMYLAIPDGAQKPILRPGKVVSSDATTFAAEFIEPITVAVEADVTAYASQRGKFFQQGARVVLISAAETRTIISFARVGQPVSADKRQVYRVSTATAGMLAQIGSEKKCPIVDMSGDGFGAILSRECRIGSVQQVVLVHEEQQITMSVRTQTAAPRPDGKFRCGFLAIGRGEGRKALQQISAAIQRQQLRRLSGAA